MCGSFAFVRVPFEPGGLWTGKRYCLGIEEKHKDSDQGLLVRCVFEAAWERSRGETISPNGAETGLQSLQSDALPTEL